MLFAEPSLSEKSFKIGNKEEGRELQKPSCCVLPPGDSEQGGAGVPADCFLEDLERPGLLPPSPLRDAGTVAPGEAGTRRASSSRTSLAGDIR